MSDVGIRAITERIERSRNEKVARMAAGCAAAMAFFVLICLRLDIRVDRLFSGAGRFLRLVTLFFPPSADGAFPEFLVAMGETLSMALWGTIIGACLAIPLAFVAAANVNRIAWLRALVRRVFDVVRGIDSLVWALVFVHVVGLGPFAGILAIAVMDSAVLGKLFSEAIETADRAEIDGVLSAGAGPLTVLRFGYFPQLAPIFLSNVLYFFESNVRSASILGVLGAGGIGMQMMDRIRIMDWPQVGFILIMILVCIGLIDAASKRLRLKIAGSGGKD